MPFSQKESARPPKHREKRTRKEHLAAQGLFTKLRALRAEDIALALSSLFAVQPFAMMASDRQVVERIRSMIDTRSSHEHLRLDIEGAERIHVDPQVLSQSVQYLLTGPLALRNVVRIRLTDTTVPLRAGHASGGHEAAHCTMSPGAERSEIVFTREGIGEESDQQISRFTVILVHELVHATLDPDNAATLRPAFRRRLATLLEAHIQIPSAFPYVQGYHGSALRRAHEQGRARPSAEDTAQERVDITRETLAMIMEEAITMDIDALNVTAFHQAMRTRLMTRYQQSAEQVALYLAVLEAFEAEHPGLIFGMHVRYRTTVEQLEQNQRQHLAPENVRRIERAYAELARLTGDPELAHTIQNLLRDSERRHDLPAAELMDSTLRYQPTNEEVANAESPEQATRLRALMLVDRLASTRTEALEQGITNTALRTLFHDLATNLALAVGQARESIAAHDTTSAWLDNALNPYGAFMQQYRTLTSTMTTRDRLQLNQALVSFLQLYQHGDLGVLSRTQAELIERASHIRPPANEGRSI
ncbi:MAG: hypothetical protein WCV84_03875 [Patescibacteria group bacterium]